MKSQIRIGRGQYRGRIVRMPPDVKGNTNVTPALIKEAVFQLLDGRIGQDPSRWSFYDLCAGSGQMSFEALSIGYGEIHMVEVDPKRTRFLLNEIKSNSYKILYHNRDFRRMAGLIEAPAVLYLDPPYSFWEEGECPSIDRLFYNLLIRNGTGEDSQKRENLSQPGNDSSDREVVPSEEGKNPVGSLLQVVPDEELAPLRSFRYLIVIQGPSEYIGLQKMLEEYPESGVNVLYETVRDYRAGLVTLLDVELFREESDAVSTKNIVQQ